MATWQGNHQLLNLWERHTKLSQNLANAVKPDVSASPLSRWVRPDDRGVPMDLVRQSVGSLLSRSFDELAETRGVGLRKLALLIELLERVEVTNVAAAKEPTTGGASETADLFGVSRAKSLKWLHDVAAVRAAGIVDMPLGRLTPALSAIPRSLWEAPLARFTDLTYGELFTIPYFGPRRIENVVGIVDEAARLARERGDNLDDDAFLAANVRRAAAALREWLSTDLPLTHDVIERELVEPLTAQLAIDGGPRTIAVAGILLGLELRSFGGYGDATDARRLSRPRVCQIKQDIFQIFRLRWPQRNDLLEAAIHRAVTRGDDAVVVRLLVKISELVGGKFASALSASAAMEARRPNEGARTTDARSDASRRATTATVSRVN